MDLAFRTVQLIDEAWENRACENRQFGLADCGTPGNRFTPISLAEPDARALNFRLADAPIVQGRVLSSLGGTPVTSAGVRAFDQSGSTLAEISADLSGRYRLTRAPSSTFFLGADAFDHAAELFENVPCPERLSSCSTTGATPLQLAPGQVRQIDFVLEPRQVVRVTHTVDGAIPVGAFAAAFDLLSPNGAVLATAFSNSTGVVDVGPVDPGSYRLRVTPNTAFRQLFASIECESDCLAELSNATPIVVLPGVRVTEVSIDLRSYPRISGRVSEVGSGDGISGVTVKLSPLSGSGEFNSFSEASGAYTLGPVAPGTYLISFFARAHLDELFDDVPCEDRDPTRDCPGGTPITIARDNADQTVNAELRRSGSIAGSIAVGGQGLLPSASVYLLNPDGSVVTVNRIGQAVPGRYDVGDFSPGTYRVALVSPDTITQIYPLLDCPTAPDLGFGTCDLGATQLVTISAGSTTPGIDFLLRRRGSKAVRVVAASSGDGLAGIDLDLWAPARFRLSTHRTDRHGLAWVGPGFGVGPYFLSTDNNAGYIDEVYDDMPCPDGSVFFGSCSLTGGTTIALPESATVAPIVIALERGAEPPLFGNGFE